MKNGARGLINGVAWYPNRLLLRLGRPCYTAVGTGALLETFCSGTLLAVPEDPECYRLAAADAGYHLLGETPCVLLRLFGVAVVGGGVLREVLPLIWEEAAPLAVSVSEAGAAFALSPEQLPSCRERLIALISD